MYARDLVDCWCGGIIASHTCMSVVSAVFICNKEHSDNATDWAKEG